MAVTAPDRPGRLALSRQRLRDALSGAARRTRRAGLPLRLLALAAFLLAAVAAQVFRQSGEPPWRTIWAEDGAVFLTQALHEPFTGVVFDGYAGYAHLVPRLIAAAVEPLPAAGWPAGITLACALVTALLAVYVYGAAGSVIPSARRRALLALAVVLLPVAGAEVMLNTANLHFYLVFAALIAFLDLRPTRTRLVAGVAIVVAATLSDPLALLLFPLALWRLVRRRERSELVLPVCFAIAAGGQLWVMAHSPGVDSPDAGLHREAISLYGYRVLAELLFGDRFYPDVVLGIGGRATLVTVFLLLAFVLGYRWLRQARAERAAVALFVAASATAWAAATYERGIAFMLPVVLPDGMANLGNSRYSIVPMLCLIAALLVPATRQPARSPLPRLSTLDARARMAVSLLAASWLVALVGINYRWTNLTSAGPSFQTWLPLHADLCRNDPAGEAVVPIHPTPETGPWTISIPCDRLARYAQARGITS